MRRGKTRTLACMPMFPPELESTKYSGTPAPPPKPYWWEGPKRHPKSFWHASLAFALANSVYAYFVGGLAWHYVMAVFVGFAFAFRWHRNLATLRWIYGFAAGYGAFAFVLAWLHAG